MNIGVFQPFLFYQLGKGMYLRSTAVMTYDFENDMPHLEILNQALLSVRDTRDWKMEIARYIGK